jgi:PAS domain S-box-containing protein
VEEVLIMARATGKPAEIRAHAAPRRDSIALTPPTAIDISATSFRAGDAMMLLVRARATVAVADSAADSRLTEFVQHTPDAVTITDSSGRVLMANPAFAALCQLPSDGLVGRSVTELLGDPQQMLRSILTAARHDGIAEHRQAVVGRHDGSRTEVEISATLLADGDQECIGLSLRRVDRRPRTAGPHLAELTIAISDLAAQMGAKTLPEMLEEVAVLAERHWIDSALIRSRGDHTDAARLLGVSADDLALRMQKLAIHREADSQSPGPAGAPLSRLH